MGFAFVKFPYFSPSKDENPRPPATHGRGGRRRRRATLLRRPWWGCQIRHEKQRLERENARLRLKLERAEKLLALQKKMADILNAIDRDERQSSGGKLA